ncbi:MAG TPA: ribonuclease III [Gammaproteobacteria bacterium]|nr:ribonuclease III [Gammaproteobacteria bacterium]
MSDPGRQFIGRLGYVFKDGTLLDRALTHRSAGSGHNERLEFLGDSIINFIMAEVLFRAQPDAREGQLTRLRALLVRRDTLAAVARELDLGMALKLGGGELKSGGRDRDSILADALEALVGAVYLDSGIESCRELVQRLFAEKIAQAQQRRAAKDAKTRLQERLQAKGLPLPSYEVVEVKGAPHNQEFQVFCRVASLNSPTCGTGGSRRKAEQAAARLALEQLDDQGR